VPDSVPRETEADECLLDLLDRSFAEMVRISDTIAGRFFDRLFTLHPNLRRLFPREPAAQRATLMNSLAIVVRGVRNPPAMRREVQELGASHIGFGATSEHDDIVCDLLLQAMRSSTPDWTPLLDDEWRHALRPMASVLLSRPIPGASKSAA
jgi:hemoglobin-like flavoprotein